MVVFFAFTMQANAREIYRVSDVAVFVEAENSNDARKIALENGEKDAYEELVKRFLDYGYMDAKPNLSDKQIDQIISRMQVKDEVITDKTYSAKLDFWFTPTKTANIFKIEHKQGIPTRSKYLVLPMLIDGNDMKIWETKWLESWANYRKKDLIVPIGDLDDIQILKIDSIKKGDYKTVDAIARRYKTPIIILAKAEYIALDNSMKVKLERLEGSDIEFYEFIYPGGFGIGAFELYEVAANDILYRLQNKKLAGQEPEEAPQEPDYYRNYDSDRIHKFKELEAKVLAKDLAEWSRIRRKILKSEYIEDLKVGSFKAGEVIVNIKYNGNFAQLNGGMDMYGLMLESDEFDNWTIKESQKAVIEVDEANEGELKFIEAEKKKELEDHRFIKNE